MIEKKSKYPLFTDHYLKNYHVGKEIIILKIDTKYVFPPSETTLTLAEVISKMHAESALDIGTGSGLLAIMFAKLAYKNIYGIDKNPSSVKCALENFKINGVQNKITCEVQDVFSWDTNLKFDLIVSNPPFMPMPKGSKFISNEIQMAINGGVDGTEILIAFAEKAYTLLSPKGRFIFGLPKFVNHSKVLEKISTKYDVREHVSKKIRYWLAEYDKKYEEHINKLSLTGEIDVSKDGKYIKTDLLILECFPKK